MNFTDLLDQHNLPKAPEGHHHAREGWIQIDCPFCGKDSHRWNLGYSAEGNYFHCWRCGYHSMFSVLGELLNLKPFEIKKLLKGLKTSQIPRKPKPKGKLKIPDSVGPLNPVHLQYLRRRKFSPEELENLWEIKGIGMEGSGLAWSIFIPIFFNGKIVSWTTRSLSTNPNVVRYINAPSEEEDVPMKSLLYGEDYATDSIVICEGPFDVWRIGPGAVATMSINYTQAQLERMAEYSIRAICFDNEKTARQRAKKLLKDLSPFPGKTYRVILDAKDPASASPKEIRELRHRFLDAGG